MTHLKSQLFYLIVCAVCTSVVTMMQWTRYTKIRTNDMCAESNVSFVKENLTKKEPCFIECARHTDCKNIVLDKKARSCVGCKVDYNITNTGPPIAGSRMIYYEREKCPLAWFNIENSCYYVVSEGPFLQGVNKCLSLNASPLALETVSENEDLKSILSSLSSDLTERFYSGYTDVDIEGTWKLYGTNETLLFDNWADGEKSLGATENCLALQRDIDYLWIDVPCGMPLKMICEKPSLR